MLAHLCLKLCKLIDESHAEVVATLDLDSQETFSLKLK